MTLKRADRLLLKCLTAEPDEGSVSRLGHLTPLDWDLIVEQSIKHVVTPLLYQQVKKFGPSLPVRSNVLKRLREIYLTNAASNMRLYHELSKVLRMLKDEGIPVIALKGGHLAEIVYENLGLRSMTDMDLLFRRQDLAAAQKKLMDAGYYPHNKRLPLDIHWNIEHNIVPPLPIDEEGLWQRAQPASIAGVEVLVLSPEDLLLHTCLHLSFHHLFGFAGLRTLYDIREIIAHYRDQIIWKHVCHRARKWSAGNSVSLALLLAKELLNAEVPVSVFATLGRDGSDSQKQWAVQQIFNGTADGFLLSPLFCFLWRPVSFRKKAAYFLKFMFPPAEHVSERYDTTHRSSQNYLSYVTRVKEHFGSYARATWKLLTRDQEVVELVRRQNQNTAMREWLSSN